VQDKSGENLLVQMCSVKCKIGRTNGSSGPFFASSATHLFELNYGAASLCDYNLFSRLAGERTISLKAGVPRVSGPSKVCPNCRQVTACGRKGTLNHVAQ